MPKPSKSDALDALLRMRLAAFTRKAFETVDPGATYLHNWHIDLIAEYLEACTRREIKRLIINIPPRMMKSIMVTASWPAWLLGKNPSERIVASSYAATLALKHSVDTRLIIQSDWYRRAFRDVVLTGDQNEKSKFVTTARGHRIATSVGASVIGEGGNFLIVDDPHSPAQTLSEAERNTALDWFDQGFSTRLDDKKNGVIVVVMQRLHQNDLSGHLLAKGGWEHLCIPAIAETKTIIDFGRIKITREAGDLLHPQREGPDDIERMKREMGSYAFAGQYQQRPAPADGGIFKKAWLKRYDVQRESYKRIIQSWDTASKPGERNDPSVCITFGEHENGFDVLQVLVKRMEYPALKRSVISQAEAFCPDAVLIEDKSSGQALIQDLRNETSLPVIAVMPTADKITRASAVTPIIEAGRMFIPALAHWVGDFENELMSFPNGAHDDQVDALSQYMSWSKKSGVSLTPSIRRL